MDEIEGITTDLVGPAPLSSGGAGSDIGGAGRLQRDLAQLRARMWNARYVAVANLAPLAGGAMVQRALAPLLNDIDFRVRRATVRALAPFVATAGVRSAFETLREDGDAEVRRLVAGALPADDALIDFSPSPNG